MKRFAPTMVAIATLLLAAPVVSAQEAESDTDSDQGAEQHSHEHSDSSKVEYAVAVLRATQGSDTRGVVFFRQMDKKVRVIGKIVGLSPGEHGFHIHTYGDLTGWQDGKSAGGHFDPRGMPHGKPSEAKRHIGDLGNITANDEGVATFDMTDDVISLTGGHAIIGRAVVVHKGADEFVQPTGNAGPRAAVGVIGIGNPESYPVESDGS